MFLVEKNNKIVTCSFLLLVGHSPLEDLQTDGCRTVFPFKKKLSEAIHSALLLPYYLSSTYIKYACSFVTSPEMFNYIGSGRKREGGGERDTNTPANSQKKLD